MTMMNYTIEEMRNERELIQSVFDSFKNELDKKLRSNNGILSLQQMNLVIDTTIHRVKLNKEQRVIVEAFFDTYIGAWAFGGLETADSFAILSFLI
jgi:hypothetical protein